MTFAGSGPIGPDHLPSFLRTSPPVVVTDDVFTLHLEGRTSVNLPDAVRRFEDAIIQWAMRRAGGQQSRASENLGLARTTLQSKLGRSP